ncbi:hypothetical protein D3C85_937870 [compost metagenome]
MQQANTLPLCRFDTGQHWRHGKRHLDGLGRGTSIAIVYPDLDQAGVFAIVDKVDGGFALLSRKDDAGIGNYNAGMRGHAGRQ